VAVSSQRHRVRRIGDDLAGEGDAHAAGLGQQIDAMLGLVLIAGAGSPWLGSSVRELVSEGGARFERCPHRAALE